MKEMKLLNLFSFPSSLLFFFSFFFIFFSYEVGENNY